MHASFKTSFALLATALVGFTQANIDPQSVSPALRSAWCQSQITACPLLCLQQPEESATTAANDCNPENLSFNCVCGNGLTPNASEYSQTIPYFQCTEQNNQCVARCGGQNQCESDCRTKNLCGAQNPTRVNKTATATKDNKDKDSNSDGNVVYNGLGDSNEVDANMGTTLNLGRSYGTAVVLTGLLAAFAVVM